MMGEAGDEHPPLPAMLQLYVEDVDAVFMRAVQAGATSLREPENQFYGDLIDDQTFGHSGDAVTGGWMYSGGGGHETTATGVKNKNNCQAKYKEKRYE